MALKRTISKSVFEMTNRTEKCMEDENSRLVSNVPSLPRKVLKMENYENCSSTPPLQFYGHRSESSTSTVASSCDFESSRCGTMHFMDNTQRMTSVGLCSIVLDYLEETVLVWHQLRSLTLNQLAEYIRAGPCGIRYLQRLITLKLGNVYDFCIVSFILCG